MQCPICHSSKTRKHGVRKLKNKIVQRYLCHTCSHVWADFNKSNKRQRVIIVSDMHCGHLTGLTPSEFQVNTRPYADFRKESWTWFLNTIALFKPFDYAIFNGDAIDGKQKLNGGLELLYPDRFDQVRMATAIANKIDAAKNIVIRGSKYHVGKEENFEDDFAERIHAPIYNHLVADIGGVIWDVRHKIGRSGVPYGRVTPLSRQVTWSRLKAEKRGTKTRILVRSHVHYYVSLEESGVMAFTTPALQGASEYGAQECDGEVDYGLTIVDIYPDGRIVKQPILPVLKSNEPEIVVI